MEILQIYTVDQTSLGDLQVDRFISDYSIFSTLYLRITWLYGQEDFRSLVVDHFRVGL